MSAPKTLGPRSLAAPTPRETVGELVDRAALQEFQRKALIYSAVTIAGFLLWLAYQNVVPGTVALPLLGGTALEAWKNISRWHEWRKAHPNERVHPDRVLEMQRETLAVLGQAARAHAWFTRATVACIAVPSVLTIFAGLEASVARASVDPVAIRGGDWLRLITGTYLHGSVYHFFGNMSSLLLYGAILEMKAAHSRLPLVYLLSALGGSLLSAVMPPDVPSVGASGGIVGVIAYLFLFSRRQAVKFPPAFHGATATVFVGLFTAGALGFWYIDNPGHAGGALTGLLLAGLTVDQAQNYGPEIEMPMLDLLGWIAAGAILAGSILTCLKIFG